MWKVLGRIRFYLANRVGYVAARVIARPAVVVGGGLLRGALKLWAILVPWVLLAV